MYERQEIIKVRHLTKHFTLHMQAGKRITGCEDISFNLSAGESMGIVGPSGAGKSTIMKCIYRTYLPTAGQILYRTAAGETVDLATAGEREIVRLRHSEIGYVSQFLKVIPRVSAVDTVAEGLRQRGWRMEEARRQAREILTMMNIDQTLWDTYPSTFSGGEQQRINLARVLVTKPRLLLLDEPTASLDGETKKVVIQALLHLKKQGTAMIGIFHDLEAMNQLVDKVFSVKTGQCSPVRQMQEVV